MKKYLIIIIAVMLPLFGCEDDNKDRKFMAFDELVVLDYLAETPQYTEWYNLILQAGMGETFRLSTTPMTCFIVNNEALLSYLKEKYGIDRVGDLDQEDAKTLVKYHTLPNTTMYLSSFRNGKLADSTASGDYLACLFTSGDDGAVYLNQESKIINYDKVMVNGIIHEIDQVIDPVVNTFMDYLQVHADRYSIMNEMIEACPDSTKALFSQLQDNKVKNMKCRRTLFVVPDEVYHAKGYANFAELKAKLPLSDAEVEQYVRYHLLSREMYGKDIIQRLEYGSVTKAGDGSSSLAHQLVDEKGVALETMAANKLILAKDDGIIDILFNEDATDGGVKFLNETSYNIPLKNGVLHELDGVLKMADPASMITLVELTDYINFEKISTYRQEGLGKTQTLMEAEDYAPYIKWESTPVTKGDAVAYVVFTEGSYNFKGNGFLNGDCLYISPGPVGFVEFITPPIPKGTYSVWPFYKTTKNTGGKYKVSIDGNAIGGEFTAYTPGYDNYWITKLGTVTFTETKSHTIRVAVGSRQGEMLLDMFILEPII